MFCSSRRSIGRCLVPFGCQFPVTSGGVIGSPSDSIEDCLGGERMTGGSSIVICWDRRSDDLVIGTFVPGQIQFLREQLCGLGDLLDWRMRQYSTEYPLGDQLGMPLPQEPPDDDRL